MAGCGGRSHSHGGRENTRSRRGFWGLWILTGLIRRVPGLSPASPRGRGEEGQPSLQADSLPGCPRLGSSPSHIPPAPGPFTVVYRWLYLPGLNLLVIVLCYHQGLCREGRLPALVLSFITVLKKNCFFLMKERGGSHLDVYKKQKQGRVPSSRFGRVWPPTPLLFQLWQ